MAVVSVTDTTVWKSGNLPVCMAIIGYCEASLGRRDFINRFKASFAHGYNHIALEDENDEAVRSFRDCVCDLAESADSFNRDWLESFYDAESLQKSLKDLVDLIDRERLNAP